MLHKHYDGKQHQCHVFIYERHHCADHQHTAANDNNSKHHTNHHHSNHHSAANDHDNDHDNDHNSATQ